MIRSIKISGFKNFRGRTVELKKLSRINLLVGINGSGKSSVLELLMGVSKLSQLNGDDIQEIEVGSLAQSLHSLFEPETKISFSYTTGPGKYSLKITTQPGNRWQVEKKGNPSGGTDVVAILRPGSTAYNDHVDSSKRSEHPFGGIRVFDRDESITLPDLNDANTILSKVNPQQRSLRPMNLSSGQFTFENDKEVRAEFLAGGNRYLAGLIAAIRDLSSRKPILIIDDLGDELFPAVRKRLVSELNEMLENSLENKFAQIFATTHNIEIVKSALNHPEYCSVYMFDYSGGLVEFDGSRRNIVDSSNGIQSADAVPAIARMLGMDAIDLGFPELVILVEEESKKSFIEGLLKNERFNNQLREVDVLVPFQSGDGSVPKAIQNMLDLSKYLFFSEIWSDRYAIFTDYNETDYEPNGVAKTGSSRQRALFAAQNTLGLDRRYLLTKHGENYVTSIEDTYPNSMWEAYKRKNKLNLTDIKDYLASEPLAQAKGGLKNKLASYIGGNITLEQFEINYPQLSKLLLRNIPIPLEEDSSTPIATEDLIAEPVQVEMYDEAKRAVVEAGKASASLLQRRLRVGYARAARLIDLLEDEGVIGPADGARPRAVLITINDL